MGSRRGAIQGTLVPAKEGIRAIGEGVDGSSHTIPSLVCDMLRELGRKGNAFWEFWHQHWIGVCVGASVIRKLDMGTTWDDHLTSKGKVTPSRYIASTWLINSPVLYSP